MRAGLTDLALSKGTHADGCRRDHSLVGAGEHMQAAG